MWERIRDDISRATLSGAGRSVNFPKRWVTKAIGWG
jgi:hypothetical protein